MSHPYARTQRTVVLSDMEAIALQTAIVTAIDKFEETRALFLADPDRFGTRSAEEMAERIAIARDFHGQLESLWRRN